MIAQKTARQGTHRTHTEIPYPPMLPSHFCKCQILGRATAPFLRQLSAVHEYRGDSHPTDADSPGQLTLGESQPASSLICSTASIPGGSMPMPLYVV
jgi:hypothetical protein